MNSDSNESNCSNESGTAKPRWKNLQKILKRSGPFCQPDFDPVLIDVMSVAKVRVLVIGAGGLGCELLKDLALMGFRNIHVIDMDTIELSNLNRQFLFRRNDIGKSKAEVAAKFINDRIPGASVQPHFGMIQDFDESFYKGFNLIMCGLDSIVARRWMNGMLMSLIEYDFDGVEFSATPMIDGGTEGFKGSARCIIPGMTACIECTLDLYPPQVTYPLCTIANTPRLPEHCIEYVKVIQWPKENPWNNAIDGDDPAHINWIHEKASERAAQFNIQGVTYRLVQGVVKNIIPAVASTNAVIAAACATEAFKMVTGCCAIIKNYMMFNDVDGLYTYTYEAEQSPECLACSQETHFLTLSDPKTVKLQDVITLLCEKTEYQMKGPGLTTMIEGKNKTLYISTVKSIESATRPNLTKTLEELGVQEGSLIYVADVTTPTTLEFSIHFECNDHDVEMY